MSRISGCFEALGSKGRKALIPFVTAGDPSPDITVPLMHAMVEAGADILEFGVPFSDPMAEGPVIQKACERALKHHVSLRDVLKMVAGFRKQDQNTPIVLMGYLNPIEVMGYCEFAKAARLAGVDGVLTVDLPPEEAEDLVAALRQEQLDPIFLLAPTSTDQRIEKISAMASGFIYYVSLKGVTGAASLDVASVTKKLLQIRSHTSMPVGVGFGIRNAENAASIAAVADAVVVGSALVNIIAHYAEQADKIIPEVTRLVADMRKAIDTVGNPDVTTIN